MVVFCWYGRVACFSARRESHYVSFATQRKTPLTEYTLQCEYGQLAGIAIIRTVCREDRFQRLSGRLFGSGWRFLLPGRAFSTKLKYFSRAPLQLLAIAQITHLIFKE